MADKETPEDADAAGRRRFGEALASLRKQRGLSQADVATRLGVTQAMLSHIESGRRRPSSKLLPELLEILGVDPASFPMLTGLAAMEESFAKLTGEPPTYVDIQPAAPAAGAVLNPAMGSASFLPWLALKQLSKAMERDPEVDGAPADRLELLADVVNQLRDLDANDLAKVSGFVSGLSAATEKGPDIIFRSPNEPPIFVELKGHKRKKK